MAGESAEYDPHLYREVEKPTTNLETLIHLVKGSVGTGILALPMAIYRLGYVLGPIAMVIITILCTYTMHLLVKCAYELCKRKKVPVLNYTDTAKFAFLEGPPFMQKCAPCAVLTSNIFLIIYQMGSCSIYTLFLGENFQKFLHLHSIDVDVRLVMTGFLIPLILINFIRNLKLLAPFTGVANIATIISCIIIFYYIFKAGITLEDRDAIGDLLKFPLFFGTVVFAVLPIGVIMPLENEMKTPKSYVLPFGVLNVGMFFILLLYVSMAVLGYLGYGKDIKGSITLNLPNNEIPTQIVLLMFILSVWTSHALQLYVAIDIVWNQCLLPDTIENKTLVLFYEYLTRTALVVICYLLAVAIPHFALVVSFIGVICISVLGLVFPGIFDISTFWYSLEGPRGKLIITKDIFLILFGIFFLISGIYTSVLEVIDLFRNEN